MHQTPDCHPPSRAALKVILGAFSIKAFVASPKKYDIVGVVTQGMEFGLLGLNESGKYFRINGSHIAPLDFQQVELAMAAARLVEAAKQRAKIPLSLPTVVMRKRRVAVMPCIAEQRLRA
jgi:hypothetical protein